MATKQQTFSVMHANSTADGYYFEIRIRDGEQTRVTVVYTRREMENVTHELRRDGFKQFPYGY